MISLRVFWNKTRYRGPRNTSQDKVVLRRQEFWKRFGCSPNGHVEDVTADGTRHGHVAVSLSRHDDACDEVRYAGASCEERQAHHFRRYGHCVAGDVRPPDHQVRVRRDPEDRADERYREQLLP